LLDGETFGKREKSCTHVVAVIAGLRAAAAAVAAAAAGVIESLSRRRRRHRATSFIMIIPRTEVERRKQLSRKEGKKEGSSGMHR
jgi:hypothetical protein